ncbi:Transcription elongation factor Spt6 [Mycena indigotica]|uniref:Transcription elongation factor SPT6 n=1 Tax=Mycena indigotica TaxID=2126181 RepID=A0A8H6VUZ1_9AGAR|nr:Transcription elongation factor Spt6 [Mycena indigotica]KAF7294872.1 Transcription elongation factor Spt6 [Mycena indigotica]
MASVEEDDPMAPASDEGEGDVIMPGAAEDSSEEEEDDEEEARRVREGFIVDEDDDEDDDEERRERRRRRKRVKRQETDDDLEEDDLALLEENTGASFKKKKNRLTRLRRRDGSESPPSHRRANLVVSSDDDLDQDEPRQTIQDLQNIWDNHDDDGQDTDDFIDDSDDPDAMNDQERDERRKKQQQARRKMARARPELTGIDASSWQEIYDVFGDGHDYDYAMEDDDGNEGEYGKAEAKFTDVFEPSAIQNLFLTEDDDLIRVKDAPERMQLASSTLSKTPVITPTLHLSSDELDDAAIWVTPRISKKKAMDYFTPSGELNPFSPQLVEAVTYTLRQLFIEFVEVPFIWHHRRDHLLLFSSGSSPRELLDLKELWRIYALGQKYCSLRDRRRAVAEAYARLKVTDTYYEQDIVPRMESAEVVADTSEWLLMKYKDKRDDEMQFRFHDDNEEEQADVPKHKMPSRISAYEVAKKSVISKLTRDGFGIAAPEIVQNFLSSSNVNFLVEQELNPLVYAEQFVNPDPMQAETPDELLRKARMILATELGKDPLLRAQMRDTFRSEGRVTIHPTDTGILKISEDDPSFSFKYLEHKPIHMMYSDAQFLHMLKAEEKNLVTISISLADEDKGKFERRLMTAFESDSFSESARAWNEQGSLVVREVLEQHLIPMGAKWIREHLRDEVEDALAQRCADELRKARLRVDVTPVTVTGMKEDRPSVLAISWGKGDPHRNVITVVYLDPRGRMREQTQLDNLTVGKFRDEFIDLLRRRQPDVIGISGFNMTTVKLMMKVKEIIHELSTEASSDAKRFENAMIIYVRDEVARLYQHSQRAQDEFSGYTTDTKYCIGLGRYVQSPLNEYAALGSDISTLLLLSDPVETSFKAIDQHLVPQEKLLIWCERVLIDVVNKVGVDINRAVGDAYYQTLLPYVCGLGPRKAQQLVKMIERLGENIINREQFIKSGLLTKSLFINAAGFIRITQQEDPKTQGKFRAEDEHTPDPLDNTRIHPEDYELARKMAMDAVGYDEDDIQDKHPSWVVGLIMDDSDNERKLSELDLDEFAEKLKEANHDLKRFTLDLIKNEFMRPFAEKRSPFPYLSGPEVLTMLSGETTKSLRPHLIVSAVVLQANSRGLRARLDSGLEGPVEIDSLNAPKTLPQKGQTITTVIRSVTSELQTDEFFVHLALVNSDGQTDDKYERSTLPDLFWDGVRYQRDKDLLARKKRAEVDRTRKIIKHPNFHNFNSSQAETFLEKQQRGDVVIRPSSKGADHLAVTWKVEDQLYQHIDVTEVNDPRAYGPQYIIDSAHTYSDLDELIVNHVQAMARKVEELMAHDRYKAGSEDDLHIFLKNSLAANPGKSMYGFTLNRKRPGHFSLCFLANKNSHVQNWPVRVTPESYMLFDAAAVGVPELCDAFKVRHLHESQSQQTTAGSKTPFGAGGRTPARPGNATPGHLSVRQAATPNPYTGAQTPSRYGAPPPAGIPQTAYGYPPNQPQPPYGYQTPGHRPGFPPPGQPPLPAGMNPQRAAMIQQGWQ